jgi:hypothetical protein
MFFFKNTLKKSTKCNFVLLFLSHGTRCAGEVSGARDNGVCGTGVAYDSMVAGRYIFVTDPVHLFSKQFSLE